MGKNVSTLDVVILVVFAEGMSIWWGSETPYSIAKDYTPSDLIRFEAVSGAATVAIGLAASLLTRKVLPVIASIVLSLVMTWVYDWEYARANGGHNGE